MLGYASAVTPESPELVKPGVPDWRGYALIPGPCPCDRILMPVTIEARTLRVVQERCGLQSRTTVTTFEKNPFPGGSEEEEESWDAAWPTMVHTEDEQMVGPPYAFNKTWNAGAPSVRVESTACPLLEMISDEWDPGPPADNPGTATYDATIEVTEVDAPDVDSVSYADGFEGGFSGALIGGSRNALAADGSGGTIETSQWRWKIDLTDWPTTIEWPTGLVLRGSVCWLTGQYTGPSDAFDYPPFDTISPNAEPFILTKAEPVWIGEARVDDPPSVSSGNVAIVAHYIPDILAALLPFE